MNLSPCTIRGRSIDFAKYFCRYPADDRVGRHISRNNRPGGNNCTFTNTHAICYDGTSSNPNIIFNHNAIGGNALLDHRHRRIIEDMVDRKHLYQRRCIHAVSDRDAALTAQHVHFADQAICTDADERVRQVTEVVDMQHGAMHDKRIVADFDTIRTCMQINALIQVRVAPKPNLVGIPNSDTVLNSSDAVHLYQEAITQRPDANTEDGWYPTDQKESELLDNVAKRTARLPSNIQP